VARFPLAFFNRVGYWKHLQEGTYKTSNAAMRVYFFQNIIRTMFLSKNKRTNFKFFLYTNPTPIVVYNFVKWPLLSKKRQKKNSVGIVTVLNRGIWRECCSA
jgi:hypothetical protein